MLLLLAHTVSKDLAAVCAYLIGEVQHVTQGAEQAAMLSWQVLITLQVAAEVQSLHQVVHNVAAISPMLRFRLVHHPLQDRVCL